MSFLNISTTTRNIEIEDETGQPIGLNIELRPLSSPEVVAITTRHRREIMEAVRKNRDTSSLTERQTAETLGACVVGWTWAAEPKITTPQGVTIKLTPMPCTPENAKALMAEKQVGFISRQVDQYLGTESNFFTV